MADPFGRPAGPDPRDTAPAASDDAAAADTADTADPLDERLRGLARDTEPLVILAGAPAARRLGERRRARRRTGAVSVVAALAVAVGGWQLLPGSDDRNGTSSLPGTVATTTLVPPGLTERLTEELLPPSNLPFFPKFRWKTAAEPSVLKLTAACPASPTDDVLASAGRGYVAAGGEEAEYRIYLFSDNTAARGQTEQLSQQMKRKCGADLTSDVGKHGDSGDSRATYQGTSVTGSGVQVWMDRQGPYLGVLLVRVSGDPPNAKGDYLRVDSQSAECISASLGRLAAGGAPSTQPSTIIAPPPAGSTGGSGMPPDFYVLQHNCAS